VVVEQDHAAEMSRAANRFASAVAEFSRQVERLGVVRREPLSEEEAAKLADEVVHRVRSDLWAERKPKRPPLTPHEIREWEHRREERRKREGS
jgi:hypothetical protein